MASVVIVGSSNMDLIAYVPHLPQRGETLIGSKFATGYGGKGANQAVMAALLEEQPGRVAFVGKIGTDFFGEGMKKNFIFRGIDVRFLGTTSEASSGVAPIAVGADGANSIVVVPGANNLFTKEDVAAAAEVIKGAKVLLVQLEVPLEATLEALKIAKSAGVFTIFNTAPACPLDSSAFTDADLVCPNETELEILTGLPVRSANEAEAAARLLIQRGAKRVLVTLGEKGSLLVEAGGTFLAPSPKVVATDTSGAGDCFLGALAYYISRGIALREAMVKANGVAALSVQKEGTQTSYPSRGDLPPEYRL